MSWKRFSLGVLIIFISLGINAQNYLISFEGKGATTTVSTVNVENLDAGTNLTLNGNDILNLTFTIGIDQIRDYRSRLKIYPNPTAGNTALEFLPPVAGNVRITIYDITGKPLARHDSYIESFNQYFILSEFRKGFYLIIVEGRGYRFSGKLVSNGESKGPAGIGKVVNSAPSSEGIQADIDIKGEKSTIEMDYSPGETLKFTGFSGDYVTEVTDIPTSTRVITFNFKGVPAVITGTVTATSSATATCGGTVAADGGETVTARGVCWSSSVNPSANLSTKTSDGTGTGSFTSDITGLQPSSTYHVRAYATNSEGTAYGDDLTFTTPATLPSLVTTAASAITRTAATSGGNINSDGGSPVTASGICWGTSHNPSVSDSHTGDGTANGSFTSPITGLMPGTLYYLRAYATNSIGTSYGTELSFTTNPAVIATLSTADVSSVGPTTALSGGNITDDGDASITARGVCWSTNANPTAELSTKSSDGTGTGSFASNITGLQPATTYHLRAYATNSEGTSYGNERTFTTSATFPALTTSAASEITRTAATSGGNINSDGGSPVTASGICWGTSHNPSVSGSHTGDGTGNGSFTCWITGLLPGTLYYVRAYATNSVGTSYGNELSFTTNPVVIATLSTADISSVGPTTALSGGNITDDGDGSITARGVCWSTSANPTTALSSKTSNGTGTGSFTSNITGLQPSTNYHVRAFATNSAGTAYGNEIIFTTDQVQLSTLTTEAVTSVSRTAAVSGGNISDNGGGSITARGVCWSTSAHPTNDLATKTSNGTGTGSFSSSITGLEPSTTYHLRAYATNSAGTAFGDEVTFTTDPVQTAALTTKTVTSVLSTTAVSGGNISDNGGGSITARGVCWATIPSPTVSDNFTSDGTGTGSFTSNITGLQPSTTYHVRAYATNSAGTAYGNEQTFTTAATLPTLTTTAASGITRTAATSGGNIISNGGSVITASGICWSTSHIPSVSGSHTSDGAANGSFTSRITGLLPGTLYYFRAYATNGVGTSYGEELSLTTGPVIIATLSTSEVSSVGPTTALSGGNITDDGDGIITSRGICWSTSANPAADLSTKTSDGTGTGSFTSFITGLQPSAVYYVRAYAINIAGTAYGNEVTFTTIPVQPPILTTVVATSVSSTTAVTGGTITDDGGGPVTARGVCWAAIPSPTISDNITSDGTGPGSFTSNISGLQPVTTYYVRAYATNSEGTAYGNQQTFTTAPTLPSLTTIEAFETTRTTSISGGVIASDGGSPVTASGICWGTSPDPSLSGSHSSDGTTTNSFTSSMTGLLPGTFYYIRAYATNVVGTSYGNELSFTTDPAIIATLVTAEILSVGSTTALSGGNITDDGDATVTARGLCWSTSANPTADLSTKTSDGTGRGTFTSDITGLQPITDYYARAYATNSAGTAYGNEVTFTTNSVRLATLTTTVVTSVSSTTAVSGGNITDDGGGSITARGVCWATTTSPTLSDNLTSDGTGTGSFTSNIAGLQPFTTYYVRAYAINSEGTAYGSDLTFTTPAIVPTVITSPVSTLTQSTAISGGNVLADGGMEVTARGVCWGTGVTPTIDRSKSTDGTGMGSFTSNLTGLAPNTRYYVRAYATNNVGTGYGDEVTFLYLIPEINTCMWLNDSPCFLNLSFDDCQSSHLEIANLLSQYGFKGSFYVESKEFVSEPDLIDLYKEILISGHEVGSHTVNHVNLTTLDEEELLFELDSSISRINRYLNTNCTSLAHPFDESNDHINKLIFERNLFTRNYSDYYSSERPRIGLDEETEISEVTGFIDEQIANNSMCLIAGHGIDSSGYSPVTTEFLTELLNYVESVQSNNKVWVSAMSDGALYESLFREVTLTSQTDQANRQINIQLNCPDKEIYSNFNKLLFSFRINKSPSWSLQNTGIEYIESDTHYVFTIDLKQTNELTLQFSINE